MLVMDDLYGDEMRIDVVILTKNCANEVFDRCLASIKRNILVHDPMVVDAFSTDETLDTVRKYFLDTHKASRS